MSDPMLDTLKPLTRRLLTTTDLSEAEVRAIEALPGRIMSLPRHHDIIKEGERPTQCCVLLRGWAYRYRIIRDGRRQIMSFHVPGEIPDLHSVHIELMDHTLATMTPCEIAFIPHKAVYDLTATQPRIAGALWRDTLIDAGIFREWMVGIGRRSAFSRLAHLFCEMYRRLEVVGLAADHRLPWPVTQVDLADATGLSAVHINRTLRELRQRNLVSLQDAVLTILDWPGLKRAASFEPTYLHLRPDR